jgi:adenylate cyclase
MRSSSTFRLYFAIPLLIALIVGAASFIPAIQTGNNRIYDLFLHLKPAVQEEDSILLLDIDDLAIAQVGTWPWSRSVVADGLFLLAEFDAAAVVFDIEYVDRSPSGVDSRFLEHELPRLFGENFSLLGENISDLFTAIREGYIPLEEAETYISELVSINDEVKKTLLDAVRSVARDNDLYLGKAISVFGNAWATINMLPSEVELINVHPELLEYVQREIALENIPQGELPGTVKRAPAVQPAILPVLQGAAGAGFPNVVVDQDGVRRRIELLAGYKDGLYGQLVFAPLLDRMGNPELKIEKDRIILEDALISDGSTETISIPLDGEGRMLINWPPKSFEESFRHLSYNNLVLHDRFEEQLVVNLEIMEDAGYLDFYQGEAPLLDLYRYGTQLKESLAGGGDLEEYREIRNLFFQGCGELVEGPTEAAILAEIDRILAEPELSPAQRTEYEAVRREVTESFANIGTDIAKLQELRGMLTDELKDAFIIIGHTGISTTDIGVNPFEKEYMNVGTHAAVANTIMQRDFLKELPNTLAILAAVLITFLLALVIRGLAPLPSMLVGTGFVLGTFGAGLALFLTTGWYLPILVPILMVGLTFLSVSVIKFLKTEGEKSFLRNAFGHYLSNEVINQLIADPERLNLGGEKKELTAMFTDIKGFSTISEQMDPTDLVKLLNHYLTGMSDIILDLHGTIDKYEGDAIIAFFGAPVDFDEHAFRACQSAIKMKRMERDLNKRFLSEGMAPSSLLTRIGINTGDMVVGNMGTLQKMDYTIMGNAVNLAARLEGVNKRYGTWILISEATQNELGTEFVTRRLDRIRVVGINKPVRLFELVEEPSHIDDRTGEGLLLFNEGLDLFEDWDWTGARDKFTSVFRHIPEDGPSTFFIERAEKFLKTPPPRDWDGVFNLTLK